MSETLGRLSNKLRVDTDSKFRNANGVSMKMMNFRRFDISYDGVGLTRGGKDEKVVWDLYSDKPQELYSIKGVFVVSTTLYSTPEYFTYSSLH
jgi:5-methylcytosine-specific restriction enzyme A